MTDLSGYPYIKVAIRKNGVLCDVGDLARATLFVTDNRITDLVVISHGWNNDSAEAQSLYDHLFKSIKAVDNGIFIDLGDRRIGVLGIFWPSKKFADTDLFPAGGAASISGEQSIDVVEERLDTFVDALDDPSASDEIQAVRGAIADLEASPEARRLFADRIRSLLPLDHINCDDGSDRFFDADSQELFDRLKAPFLPQTPSGGGGAAGGVMGGAGVAGGAAGLGDGDWFQGVKAAGRRILNYATYYVMKARAGVVGAGGVSEVVAAVKEGAQAPRVHFVGHSFGGRVVTAASKSLGDSRKLTPNSMSLLQAAFSHNGFAKNFHQGSDGHFRSVMQDKIISGPVIVTHTHNDKANALAYPLASRLAGQDAAAIGGPDDRFGAIGANGARHTPEAIAGSLLPVGALGYKFQAGDLYNLEADAYISNHSDVDGQEVAYAILSAIVST